MLRIEGLGFRAQGPGLKSAEITGEPCMTTNIRSLWGSMGLYRVI